jgi:hypothetical protein
MLLLNMIYLTSNRNYLIKSCVGLCNYVYSMKRFTHLKEKTRGTHLHDLIFGKLRCMNMKWRRLKLRK